MNTTRVAIVDDDPATRQLLAAVLDEDGFMCDPVPTASDVRARLGHVDAVVTDFAAARELLEAGTLEIPLLIVSADAAAKDFATALGAGFLEKPFEIERLTASVRELVAG